MGELKYAKMQGFLQHILNNHSNFPQKLFNKCAHGVLDPSKPRVWLEKGTEVGMSTKTESEIFIIDHVTQSTLAFEEKF